MPRLVCTAHSPLHTGVGKANPAAGPVAGGFLFQNRGVPWLSWATLYLAAAALLFGAFMPETYGRQILRTRAKRAGRPHNLPAALSGVTLAQMARHTVVNPLKMLVAEPIVMLSALYLGLNFAVVFQWFITVPAVLSMVYGFSPIRTGLAFIAAVGGALLAAFTSVMLEQTMGVRMLSKESHHQMAPIERRMFPAMVGSLGVFASLFWIGFTASPNVSFYSPIFGTALYVWGNFSVLVRASSPRNSRSMSGLTLASRFRSSPISSTPTRRRARSRRSLRRPSSASSAPAPCPSASCPCS